MLAIDNLERGITLWQRGQRVSPSLRPGTGSAFMWLTMNLAYRRRQRP